MHLPVAHLEAGLRSFNRRMPEEHNRVLTDHCADLLLAPTEEAMRHLADEGLRDRAVLVGDVMVDICLRIRDAVLAGEHAAPALPEGIDPAQPFLLATLHRRREHRRPRAAGRDHRRAGRAAGAGGAARAPAPGRAGRRSTASSSRRARCTSAGRCRTPELVAAVLASAGVVTDSGGLQKEAFLLGGPAPRCVPRPSGSRPSTTGWNVLVPDPHELSADEWAATRHPRRSDGRPGHPVRRRTSRAERCPDHGRVEGGQPARVTDKRLNAGSNPYLSPC